MEYNKTAKGINLIFAAQTAQVAVTALSFLLSAAIMIGELITGAEGFSSFLAVIYIVFSPIYFVITILYYIVMITGVLKVSREVKVFRTAAFWIIGGIVCYFAINIFAMIGGISVKEIQSMVGNVVVIIGTLSVIDGVANIAESIGDTGIRSMAERCISYLVVAYIVIMLFDISSMIFISENTGDLVSAVISSISDLLKLLTFSMVLFIFKKAKTMMKEYRAGIVNAEKNEVIA